MTNNHHLTTLTCIFYNKLYFFIFTQCNLNFYVMGGVSAQKPVWITLA